MKSSGDGMILGISDTLATRTYDVPKKAVQASTLGVTGNTRRAVCGDSKRRNISVSQAKGER